MRNESKGSIAPGLWLNINNLSICGQHRSNDDQVVGNDTPADPPFEAFLAVVSTAVQPVPSFQDTDPSFHSIVVITASAEPTLALVLQKVNVSETAVWGYSMGGRLALQFAVAYPDRVTRLVLESASPGIADSKDRLERCQSDYLGRYFDL